jgi:hypothetical protein
MIDRYWCMRRPVFYYFLSLFGQEKLDKTFIPSGFDTIDLISISTGQKSNVRDQIAVILDTPLSQVTLWFVWVSNSEIRPLLLIEHDEIY